MSQLCDNFKYEKGEENDTRFILWNIAQFKTNHRNKSLAASYDSLVWEREGSKLTYHEARDLGTFIGAKISFITFAWHFENDTKGIWLEILLK